MFSDQVLEAESKGSTSSKQVHAESSPSKKGDVVTLRVCEHCVHMMEKRLKMVRERNSKPVIVQLYQVISLRIVLLLRIGQLDECPFASFNNAPYTIDYCEHDLIGIQPLCERNHEEI